MRKLLLIPLLLFAHLLTYSQTEQMEVDNLKRQFENREFDQLGYLERGKKWNALKDEIGGYPELPYDTATGSLRYEFINRAEDAGKEVIFKRILEYSAIKFGSLSAVLHYKDIERGKIILKGIFDITFKRDYRNFWGTEKMETVERNMYSTFIFTVKEGKFKVEVINLSYEFAEFIGMDFVRYKIPIDYFYPITDQPLDEWRESINILIQTTKEIEGFNAEIDQYVKGYTIDYEF